MYLLHRDARYFCPRLVGVGVVVEKLIAKHQRYGEETIFAAGLPLDGWVGLFQPVDEEQCKQDDVLCYLGCCQNGSNPFPEARCGVCIGDQWLHGLAW